MNEARALEEALELALRFSTAVDDGLLADLRLRRRHREPWERESEADRDLSRVGVLCRRMAKDAGELVDLAAKWEQRGEQRQAG